MMETDIASEELVKQFLLPQSILPPPGEGDVFDASPTPDSVGNLDDAIQEETASGLEGIHDTLKLESPETCSPENDILNIATTQVGLGSPVGLSDTSNVINHQPVNQACITGTGLNLNQPILILNNQIPTAWPGTSILTAQRGLYLVVDKNSQQTITLPVAATGAQIDTTQTASVLINSADFTSASQIVESPVVDAGKCEDLDTKEDKDDQDEPTQPFDYSIFLNKLPPKIEIPPQQQPANSSSIVFQVMGDDGAVKSVDVNSVETESEKIVPESPLATDSVKSNTINSTDGQIFRCDLCSATFNRKGNFTRHRLVHTVSAKDAYRYKCDKCSRDFRQKCDLNRHMHIHNMTEPHRCKVCDKGYIRMKDLVIHMKFHSKDKTLQCPHCDKNFYQSGDLKRHVRCVHDKSKGLTCGHCQRRYAKESTLIRHMQTSHRDLILQSLDHLSGKKTAVSETNRVGSTEVKHAGVSISVVEMTDLPDDADLS